MAFENRPGTHARVAEPGGLRDTAARYALLPLRVFLGVTLVYAGLDKLTDPDFPGSMEPLLLSITDAAAPWLLDMALASPEGFGYAIAFGELAVGLGTLLGLLGRLAALGGALISLSFWLTISWSVGPYYYSQDLPYLMAWVPLIMAGTPMWSLDAALAKRRRRNGGQLFG
ncbi:DoxX family membrane protein [Streptomyces sp. WMMC1477]|uniref:DoxX family membrane protein n=1 Tax=Streptomyces sp. WMMC1477 TaxID=3015155 RepID=UPI0022B6A96B|nr:DoxX family membrane protein [Streptomyces sp. WMMC1477]MCZ7433070.1 DoxX family membrane protein [Streptomyces sp. WMMC1477]